MPKTGSNLEQIRAEHAAAVKAVESENRKKLDDRRKGNGSKGPETTLPKTPPSPEFKDGKPVFAEVAPLRVEVVTDSRLHDIDMAGLRFDLRFSAPLHRIIGA